MLRVMIVGQSYVLSESRKKLTYLAGYPELSISLIVPTTWEHPAFGHYEFQPAASDASIAIFPIPIRNNGRAFAFSYHILPLWRAIRRIRPDIMQVEQEPGSLALLQFTLLARLSRAKLISFTWENLAYRQPGIRHYLERIELAQLDYLLVGQFGLGRGVPTKRLSPPADGVTQRRRRCGPFRAAGPPTSCITHWVWTVAL